LTLIRSVTFMKLTLECPSWIRSSKKIRL